jgi:hypothetical protein
MLTMIAAAVLLTFANRASAATFTPIDGASLQSAVTSANTNTDATNKIILADKLYQPTAPMTISKSGLTITSDHANQAAGGGATIDGSFIGAPAGGVPNVFVVNAGINARLWGFTIKLGGPDNTTPAIQDNGTLELQGMLLSGNNATQLTVGSGGTANIYNSCVCDGNAGGISGSSATVVLNNSTVANNANGGVAVTGTLRLNNTIVANNNALSAVPAPKDCFTPATTSDHSMDSDSSCGVTLHGNPLLGPTVNQGGPTASESLGAGSPAINAGNVALCPTTDQRFFPRHPPGSSKTSCDIGAFETGATRQTTAPTCPVTAVRAGPPKQQDVTATDTQSGLGADAVSNITITNGTVAYTAYTQPSRTGNVLTATKTDQTMLTRWSFDLVNWAGVTVHCA